MIVKSVYVKNYRLLKSANLTLDNETTLIVGRNNTGKTSLAEIFRSFLSQSGPKMRFEDFNQDCLSEFQKALKAYEEDQVEEAIRPLLPTIELKLLLNYEDDADEYGPLRDFIVDLDEDLYETQVVVSYQLKAGAIPTFFDGLNTDDRRAYYSELKSRITKLFEVLVYAEEPTNPENRAQRDYAKLKRLMLTGLINAQRGLDDETHSERDVLGKSLGKIFDSANSTGAPEEFKAKSTDINTVIEDLQKKVDTDFQDKVEALLPTLNIFGYPGLKDPNLSAATELNVKSLLESNTKVFYKRDDHFTLPETYNGLGIRNLIFILFRIYEYFREFQSQETVPKGHLIFIEEPEAHLHPQMQEVFVRQLSLIISEFQKQLNDGNTWPVQFVVSTHSSHIANEADFSKVRYFLSKSGTETTVKDLGEEFKSDENKEDKEFLHKYLTLTKCDLYFADMAILIEGATERIILPEILKKMDKDHGTNLRRKYLSVVEIGGAYAHHFYKFIDFLELKTIFVTDLDSVKRTETVKDEKSQTTYPNSIVSEGTHSSNVGISHWFGGEGYLELDVVTSKNHAEKESVYRRIVYQVPEEEESPCARSFEEAFMIANKELFEVNDLEGVDLEQAVLKKAKAIGSASKANFAIKYSVEETGWSIPKYLLEGLHWLDRQEDTAEAVEDEDPAHEPA